MPQGHDGMMAVTSPVSALMELQDTMTAQRSKLEISMLFIFS